MDEFVVSYSLENEQQFWDGTFYSICDIIHIPNTAGAELDDICSSHGATSESIDDVLRTYLSFTARYRDEYLLSDNEVLGCIRGLLESKLYNENKDYVRIQLVYSLLQDDESRPLYMIASILLCDGRQNEETFEMMNREGAFSRLVDLIKSKRGEDWRLHKRLLELLYEMSRLQRLGAEDLAHVDDEFIHFQFQNIEELSDDGDDPYHYSVIRVLVCFTQCAQVGLPLTENSLC